MDKKSWLGWIGLTLEIIKIAVAVLAMFGLLAMVGYLPDSGGEFAADAQGEFEVQRLTDGIPLMPRAFVVTDRKTGRRFLLNADGGVVEIGNVPGVGQSGQ